MDTSAFGLGDVTDALAFSLGDVTGASAFGLGGGAEAEGKRAR